MDEHQQIAAALDGGAAEFEEIIRIFSRKLYAVAYGMLLDRDDAADVVQDTFVRAFEHRRAMRDPTKVPAWLAAIARNRARDVLRKRRRGHVPLELRHLENFTDREQPPPDFQIAAEETRVRVHASLQALPEQHRMAVTLRFLEGMDYESIERTLGMSNGALRGILSRAMTTLRRSLKGVREP